MAKRPAKAPKAAQPVPAAADEPHDPSQPLANARHEAFAQELAKGLTAIKAYGNAGYKPDRGAATRLSANVSIRDRVKLLTSAVATEIVEQTACTAERQSARYDEIFLKAMAAEKFAAAATAVKLQSELHGLVPKDGGDEGMAGLLKGATIVNGQFVLNRIEILVVDPVKPANDRGDGAGGKGVHAPAPTRAVQGR